MAKKMQKVMPVYNTYEVINAGVKSKLGPHKVIQSGSKRIVNLTDKQAKFYIEQGTVRAI